MEPQLSVVNCLWWLGKWRKHIPEEAFIEFHKKILGPVTIHHGAPGDNGPDAECVVCETRHPLHSNDN